jgi:hypothetical protein
VSTTPKSRWKLSRRPKDRGAASLAIEIAFPISELRRPMKALLIRQIADKGPRHKSATKLPPNTTTPRHRRIFTAYFTDVYDYRAEESDTPHQRELTGSGREIQISFLSGTLYALLVRASASSTEGKFDGLSGDLTPVCMKIEMYDNIPNLKPHQISGASDSLKLGRVHEIIFEIWLATALTLFLLLRVLDSRLFHHLYSRWQSL